MQKLFNNILVPVDFSKDSKATFEKAIELANKYECNIHLLHVITISPSNAVSLAKGSEFVLHSFINKQEGLTLRLNTFKDKYIYQLNNERSIHTHLQGGSWDESIINFVLQNKIDLVMIGQGLNKGKVVLNVNKIAEEINIPVITVPSNRSLVKLISVVIPVTDFLPVKKLMYGVYVAQNDNATVRLLGVEDQSDQEQSRKVHHYLQKSFQLIRDNCKVPVEIATTSGRNITEAINQYAYKNPTDLIIVNPGKQNALPGSFMSFLGKIFQKISAPPVLTISLNN
jgi:nucleotide-binding universal stress UspA family protein